jgi:hypothetical protein
MVEPLELEIHATHLDVEIPVPSFQIWAVTRAGSKRHVRTVELERDVVGIKCLRDMSTTGFPKQIRICTGSSYRNPSSERQSTCREKDRQSVVGAGT